MSGAECFYPASRRGRKKLDKARKATLEDRMAQMEAMIQGQYKLPPPMSDASCSGSISNHSIFLGQMQPGEMSMNSTWDGTANAPSMSMDVSAAENSSAVSFTSGRLASSHQSQPTPSFQDPMVQGTAQVFSAGQLEPQEKADSVNTDKESIILAPQMVSTTIQADSASTDES